MNKKAALFIINPHSGTGDQNHIPDLLKKHLNQSVYTYDVAFTRFAGEAELISKEGKKRYDLIVAVGGDGTINEVARPLVNSETTLGIIPCGSGNGLARHLKISRNPKKAIQLLNKECASKIDTIRLDDRVFLNVAGVGFDAHIARLFATSKKRGFLSYVRLALREIRKFKSIKYHLIIDGQEKIEDEPFLISIANSSQYGNNAHIAPGALISDGLMDICVLRSFPFWYYPFLAFRLFVGSLQKSKYYQCWQGKDVSIIFPDSVEKFIHMDGDPYTLHDRMKFKIDPHSLNVACLGSGLQLPFTSKLPSLKNS